MLTAVGRSAWEATISSESVRIGVSAVIRRMLGLIATPLLFVGSLLLSPLQLGWSIVLDWQMRFQEQLTSSRVLIYEPQEKRAHKR